MDLSNLKQTYWNTASKLRFILGRIIPGWLDFLAISRQQPAPQREGMASAPNLLLLAWEFPPNVTGGIYRPLSFVRYAVPAGWRVTTICRVPPGPVNEAGRHMEQTIPSEAEVIRIPFTPLAPHPWPLPNVDGGVLNAIAVYRKGVALFESRPDWRNAGGTILASGPPFHSFIAGMWLARRYGWKLVLDYRDEWTEGPHRLALADGVNRDWETRCLQAADRVILTTESQREQLLGSFPALQPHRTRVIYNGWEPADFPLGPAPAPVARKPAGGTLTLAFFGAFGPWSDPVEFLETLHRMTEAHPDLAARIELMLVGTVDPNLKDVMERCTRRISVKMPGFVPKREACEMMAATDVLMLFNPPPMHRYIAGKLYEYIAAGTPILLYGEGGEAGAIIEGLEAGRVIAAGDPEAMAVALVALAEAPRLPQGDTRRHWLDTRTREHQAKRLIETLREI